jgi:hypothetical protein
LGTIKIQTIQCVTVNFLKENNNIISALDNFVKKHNIYFHKSEKMTNGYITYIMFFDGSKEGWTESNKCDALRLKFLRLISKLSYGSVYIIEHYENEGPKFNYINLNKKHKNSFWELYTETAINDIKFYRRKS